MAAEDGFCAVEGSARNKESIAILEVGRGFPAAGTIAETGANVFVFPSQGTHWTGMAVRLLSSASEFAEEMRRCDAVFTEFADWSLLDAVRAGARSPTHNRVDVLQPMLFAVMVSVAAQWRARGVLPDAVLGHAHGEIAAAYVAGALTLRDAAKVVTQLSKAITAIAGTGGMVSVPLSVQGAHRLIEPWSQSICVGAQNGPRSTVVTGDAAAVDELMAVCERDDVPAMRIPADYASQCAHVDALRETLCGSLSGLAPRAGHTVFISSVTGAGLDTRILDGDYWFANLRQPVLFEQAVRWSYEHGYRTFVQCNSHPELVAGIRESVADYGDGQTRRGGLGERERAFS